MGFRATLPLVAVLALLACPAAAGAAGIALDLEPEDAGRLDYLEVDVLGNLTEEEADAGACVWLHTDGFAKAHGRTEAPGFVEPSDPPRGQPDSGWWFEVACTDVAGNSILDGQAAVSYIQKYPRKSTVSVYFLSEADDAVMAKDSVVWNFVGKRLTNRTRIFGVPAPSKSKPGAPRLGLQVEATHKRDDDGFVSLMEQDPAYLAAKFSLDARVALSRGSKDERAITSGKGFGKLSFLFKGAKKQSVRFRVVGGGLFYDDDFGGRERIFIGPTVQAVQIKVVESSLRGCPKGRPGWLHIADAFIRQVFIDICTERSGWIAGPGQGVDVDVKKRR